MKRLLKLLMAAAVIVCAGAFTSCSNEDEPNSSLSSTAEQLVGTWRTEAYDGYYEIITLNADGSGLWHEVDLEYGEDNYKSFIWTYDDLTLRLSITFNDDTDIYELISISNDVAVIGIWEDGERFNITLYRVK